jgi:RNA recognition motif-containing protein
MSTWGISELFVANLPAETTDEELQTLFRGYGGVVEGWVAKKGKKVGAGGTTFGVVRWL